MKKSQAGFSHLLIPVGIVVIAAIVLVGIRIVSHAASNKSPAIQTKNATVYLLSKKNSAQRTTTISVDFTDSVRGSLSCTPSSVKGFTGLTTLSYKDRAHAVLTITQNRPPIDNKTRFGSDICTGANEATASAGVVKQVKLDQKWLDGAPSIKILTVNGRSWKISLDSTAYSLAFAGPDGQHSLQPYLPIEVVMVTLPSGCMSVDGFTGLLNVQNVELAEKKYPGIDAKYLALNKYYNRANMDALVISNEYTKLLSRNSGNQCQPLADSNPGGNGSGAVALPLYQ